MFNNNQEVSYLADNVAVANPAGGKAQTLPKPMINTAIDLQDNATYAPYSARADIAPYSSSYTQPTSLHQHQIDVLGATQPSSSSSFKTGLLLSSLLLVGSVAGYSLENTLKKKIKARGYGAILGSLGAIGIYYVSSKVLSTGAWEGIKAGIGFAVPIVPIFISMYQKKPLDKTTALISAGVGVIGSGYVILTNVTK